MKEDNHIPTEDYVLIYYEHMVSQSYNTVNQECKDYKKDMKDLV